MKLTFVTHKLSHSGGGVSTVVESLSEALKNCSVSIRVLGLDDSLWLNESSNWQGAQVNAFSTFGPKTLGWAPKLSKSLSSDTPDILHSHGIWMATSAQVANWGKRYRKPYIVSPHGMLKPRALAISSWKKKIAKWIYANRHLNGAHCIHALNNEEANDIRQFGLQNPIAIIPNGITLPSQIKNEPQPDWLNQFPAGSRILLYVGRIDPNKNLSSLVNAFYKLKKVNKLGDWKLAIVGWGQAKHTMEIKKLTNDLNLQADIAFIGPLFGAEKNKALQHASAFILPSLNEGLPMTVLEAWAYGLPVAMTSACNLSEGFKHQAAFEISTDPKEMAGQIDKFLQMKASDLDTMGQKGRALVQQHFSWETVADSFIDLYKWALDNGPKPDFVFNANDPINIKK